MAKTEQTGLYDATNEHDACGVGMVVNIHGNKSHELVDSALKVLENMRHRGAEGADNKTGDGAGIMLQIPHEFILLQGIPVPEKGKYGTGLVFLPKDEKEQASILSIMIEEIEREGLTLMHLRNVPPGALTEEERNVMPHFKNPAMPSVAVTADAAIKIATAREEFASTDTFLEMIGFDQADIRRIRAQEQRVRGQQVLMEMENEDNDAGVGDVHPQAGAAE